MMLNGLSKTFDNSVVEIVLEGKTMNYNQRNVFFDQFHDALYEQICDMNSSVLCIYYV